MKKIKYSRGHVLNDISNFARGITISLSYLIKIRDINKKNCESESHS